MRVSALVTIGTSVGTLVLGYVLGVRRDLGNDVRQADYDHWKQQSAEAKQALPLVNELRKHMFSAPYQPQLDSIDDAMAAYERVRFSCPSLLEDLEDVFIAYDRATVHYILGAKDDLEKLKTFLDASDVLAERLASIAASRYQPREMSWLAFVRRGDR